MVPFLTISLALLAFAAYQAYNIYHYRKAENIRNNVAWCVTKDNTEFRCNLSLQNYIGNAQIKKGIQAEYKISGKEEWSLVSDILEGFKNDLIQAYFCGSLNSVAEKSAMYGEDYFMFSLNAYLGEHECDATFLGRNMHEKTTSYKEYGTWGATLFDATYALSDFAVVFFKLKYIAYSFCASSQAVNPKKELFRNQQYIEKILDTRQIDISRI